MATGAAFVLATVISGCGIGDFMSRNLHIQQACREVAVGESFVIVDSRMRALGASELPPNPAVGGRHEWERATGASGIELCVVEFDSNARVSSAATYVVGD